MNPATSVCVTSKGNNQHVLFTHLQKHAAIWIWSVLLLIVNMPLVWGEVRSSLLYLPEAVARGQWWRTITYPLVHLSPYHLLLDAGGFLLVYGCLEEKRLMSKFFYIICSGAGSLWLALTFDPFIYQRGLSGLSGIAHGLMAVAALEMLHHKNQRTWGWISLFTVVTKSAYELCSGQVLFEFIHMGMCGQPLAASHTGGVIGALFAFMLIQIGCRYYQSYSNLNLA